MAPLLQFFKLTTLVLLSSSVFAVKDRIPTVHEVDIRGRKVSDNVAQDVRDHVRKRALFQQLYARQENSTASIVITHNPGAPAGSTTPPSGSSAPSGSSNDTTTNEPSPPPGNSTQTAPTAPSNSTTSGTNSTGADNSTAQSDGPVPDSHFDGYFPVTDLQLNNITNVALAHQQGYTGAGIIVGVMDTGVDAGHPVFANGKPNTKIGDPENKIIGGYDFTGDHYNYGYPVVPDPDPNTNCSAHATFTIGTIVGKDPVTGFVGIAPDAKAYNYKVFGCSSDQRGATDDNMFAALELAESNGVDIMSISVAGGGPYINDKSSRKIRQIADKDEILVVIAASNEGQNGTFSAPSFNGAGALSVGAGPTERTITGNWPRGVWSDGSGNDTDFGYIATSFSHFQQSPLPICLISKDINDASAACGNFTTDVTNCIAIFTDVSDGTTCTTREALANIKAHGGNSALFFNNATNDATYGGSPAEDGATYREFGAFGGISRYTAEKWYKIILGGGNVTAAFDPDGTRQRYGYSISLNARFWNGVQPFSSWGPAGDMSSAPDVVAPGIFWAPYSRTENTYLIVAGTSGSCPMVAGVAALVKQAHPTLKPSQIRRRIITSAKPLLWSDLSNATQTVYASVFQQGGGQVDAVAAIETQTDFSVDSVSFNDTQYFSPNQTFQVCNAGSAATKYSFGLKSAQTFTAFSTDNATRIQTQFPQDQVLARSLLPEFLTTMIASVATVSYSTDNVFVQPGECTTVTLTADVSPLAPYEKRCPLYSGWVEVTNDRGENLSLPYSGVGCRIGDVNMQPPSDSGAFAGNGTMNGIEIGGNDQSIPSADPITPLRKFTVPQRQFRPDGDLDIWNATIQFPVLVSLPVLYPRHRSRYVIPGQQDPTTLDAKAAAALPALEILSAFVPDNDLDGSQGRSQNRLIPWSGLLADGSWAPPGFYSFKQCMSRMWSDEPTDCAYTAAFELAYQQ